MRSTAVGRLALAAVLVLAWSSADAAEVRLALLEKKTNETTVFRIDTRTFAVARQAGISGEQVAPIRKYDIRDRRLVVSGQAVADADEILFQGEVDQDDLVIIRSEYNSYFGPLRLLSALCGHPVQVSKVLLLKIHGAVVMQEKELAREEYSYHWTAELFR